MEPPPQLAGSQEASTSAAHQAPMQQASDKLSKQVAGGSSSKPTASVSPSLLLPIELLVEILRYLSTSDAARAARVSSVWHAASNDSRIWRHLSFTPLQGEKPSSKKVPKCESLTKLQMHLRAFRARCGNTVESVDFSHLRPIAVERLAKGLLTSAPSLRYIYWKSTTDSNSTVDEMLTKEDDEAPSLAVTSLAKLCPRLETLEIFVPQLYSSRYSSTNNQVSFDVTESLPRIARPRCFRLSIGDALGTVCLREDRASFMDHVTTLEITYANCAPRRRQASLMDSDQLVELFKRNPAIERLTVHGLSRERDEPFSVSAPALKYLDLRYSTSSANSLQLDALELRELAVDARLLPSLTPASTAMLSALTLHIVSRGAKELTGAIERTDDYVGSLKLLIGIAYADDILRILSERFIWPGLEEIDIKVDDSSINDLIGVMAARQVGAVGGASREQYMSTVLKAKEMLPNHRSCETALYLAKAERVLATAGAIQHDASARPLCSQAQWKIIDACDHSSSSQILAWLSKQPNVSVEKLDDG